jgi:hypothetical protein
VGHGKPAWQEAGAAAAQARPSLARRARRRV